MRRAITRRGFLADLGRGTLAVAVLGIACSEEQRPAAVDPAPWRRVDLGFVSAYVVARRGEVAVVDTGVEGSAADIEAAVVEMGSGPDDIAHVILTHSHPDHVGSLPELLESATDATAYIGEGDRDAVDSPRPLTVVEDADTIMGLEVIETPGHTPGHISLLDRELALLIAGDALRGVDGGVAGPDPSFSDDMAAASGSIARLSPLRFDTVVFGHGEPVTERAMDQVADLVASS